ncbi:MAG: prepilin-type N-terminal cleavage/methylation domain-containing protein [Desulfobacteraceae bacterium]|nr:MAG: prepilin-type N-terminal cleavage/methylation domain-containing protein [Desulfobacteraceae bacterium]
MKLKPEYHTRGFTLIEIVVTITIAAVLSTMIFTYFGKVFTESVTPITRLKSSEALQRVMENITADYNVYPKWRKVTAYTSAGYVIPTNFNGHYYRSSGITSGTTEPIWPVNNGGTVTDNTVTWTESGRLRTLLPLSTLQTRIGAEDSDQDNAYGKYHVVRNRFTQFVGSIDQDIDTSGANTILKVTLRNESGETLTVLFVSD